MRVLSRKDFPEYESLNCDASKNIITCELQDQIKVIDEKTGDYVVDQVPVITARIDTQDYIQSFADEVGIENILKRFELTGDPNLLNQIQRPSVSIDVDGKEIIQDYSNLPSDEEQALKLAEKARAEFANLPPELVKNRSFNEFAETCTKEELIQYIQSLNKKEIE